MVKNEQKLAIRTINKAHCTLSKTNTGCATKRDGKIKSSELLHLFRQPESSMNTFTYNRQNPTPESISSFITREGSVYLPSSKFYRNN